MKRSTAGREEASCRPAFLHGARMRRGAVVTVLAAASILGTALAAPPVVPPPPAPQADAPAGAPREVVPPQVVAPQGTPPVVPPTPPKVVAPQGAAPADGGFAEAGKAEPERQDVTLIMFPRINGKVTAGKADLNLNGPVKLYDVRVEDRQGRVILTMERLEFEQSLTQLAMNRLERGPLHLIRPQAFVVFRDGTCNFAETMGDWWTEESRGKGPDKLKLEIVEGLLHVVDEAKGRQFILEPFNFSCLPEAKQPANRVVKAAIGAPLWNLGFALNFRYDAALKTFDVAEFAFRAPDYGYQLALRGSIAPHPQSAEPFLQLFGAYDYDWAALQRKVNWQAAAPQFELAGRGRLPVKLTLPMGKIVALLPKPAPPREEEKNPPAAGGWLNPSSVLGGLFGGGAVKDTAPPAAKTLPPVVVAPRASDEAGPKLVVPPAPPQLPPSAEVAPESAAPPRAPAGSGRPAPPPPPIPQNPNLKGKALPTAGPRVVPPTPPAPPAIRSTDATAPQIPPLPNVPPPPPAGFGVGQPKPAPAAAQAEEVPPGAVPPGLAPPRVEGAVPPPLPDPPRLPAEEAYEPLTPGAASSPLAALPLLDALQDLTVETSLGWERLRFRGVEMGPTEVPLQLRQAGLDVGPMKAVLNDGWLTFSCRIEQQDGRIVMFLPKGPLLTQIRLTQELCHRVLVMAAPIMAKAMKVDGLVSLTLAGGVVPLDAPLEADVSATLQVHGIHGELNPDLARIAARLGIDPVVRLLDDNVTNLRFTEGRLYHEGLGFVMGDKQLYTRGSVGVDRTIDVLAEITLPLAWLPNGPLGQRLKGTKLRVPVTGTFDAPKIGKVSSPNFNLGELGQGDGPLGNLLRNLQDPAAGRPIGQGGILDRLRNRRALRGVPPPVQPPPAQP